jgi:adenylate cyclase
MTAATQIATWLVGPARLSGDPVAVVLGLAERLARARLPLHRIRISMRVVNPLLTAWGVSWTPETGAALYSVPRTVLETSAYARSPVQHVIETRTSFRRRLRGHGPKDHTVLHELAEAGFTDYLAIPVEFGDGVVQTGMFATRRQGGFNDGQIVFLEALSVPLAAAFEPIAMRRSTASLLATFLGDGPAARVQAGAIRCGDVIEIEAAVLFTDLRGFTALSTTTAPDQLLGTLGRYFESVVEAVRVEGGDVLKFVGDGVLAIFPAAAGQAGRTEACAAALRAVSRAFVDADKRDLPPFVAALHTGVVTYGNIGSPDRLDFTVVGPTVNVVSRLEGVAKASGQRAVCSDRVAHALPAGAARLLGDFSLRGIAGSLPVFSLAPALGV